jgi:hypothetical protein
MNYEDREMQSRIRALVDSRPVPAVPLRSRESSGSWGMVLGVGVALALIGLLVGTQLRTREPATPASQPPATPTTSAPGAAVTVPTERLVLPADLTGRTALASPDGRFVGVMARDRSRAVLYRVDRNGSSPDRPPLVQLADVHGPIGAMSWLEDSSALLVTVDTSPTASAQGKPARTIFRIDLIKTDGTVVRVPGDTSAFSTRRALLSPDSQWFPVYGDCCGSSVRLLSRSGDQVREVVPPPTDGSGVGFVGWDQTGLLLYQQIWPDHSALTAVDLNGTIKYSVAAPQEFGGVGWNVVTAASDRSWQVLAFGRGIGSDFAGYRLLVGNHLRVLPAEVEQARDYGYFTLDDQLLYRAGDGSMRTYDITAGTTRELSLVVGRDATTGLGVIGALGHLFVWTESTRGFVGDLATGRAVDLPLQSPPYVDRLDDSRLADYLDDGIVLFNLPAWVR